MTDLDPAIWENETLGAAAGNTRLDVVEKQSLEDRNAKLEGREPREVVTDNTYPGFQPELNPRTGTVPSNVQTVHFADEQQNDVPEASGPSDETAAGIDDETETDSEVAFIGEVEDDSNEEGNSTQWT